MDHIIFMSKLGPFESKTGAILGLFQENWGNHHPTNGNWPYLTNTYVAVRILLKGKFCDGSFVSITAISLELRTMPGTEQEF